MDGYIHSIESFGTLDGPGIRMVIFCQGCPMRCLYCHNPDTWEPGKGMRMSAQELIDQYQRNSAFYSRGGITVTGGEPLLQIDFLLELLRLAKGKGIHTYIDTSGVTYREDGAYHQKLNELMKYTDLVMLDIKHIEPDAHRRLTGHDSEAIRSFARYLQRKGIPVWIRHVVVPGYTDGEEDLRNLGRFIGSLDNVKALDVLPYHTMGVPKYRELGLAYPLEGVKPMDKQKAVQAKETILSGLREARAALKAKENNHK